ncbi:hypothetical protein [Cryobacterium sp. TMT3-29-2]|uniref:hypothetical protein n=1 Tax=Cryobacterium sp. TMT3-29-2 TaxID=2555867 RepID=UPI0010731D04|nr:hypothetical protein [Cryobacterium sp. TMT3-29-2]TFC85150.1 hypothetical protein E3O67_12275 [Cryobacterium sp. TMT3-29-2]
MFGTGEAGSGTTPGCRRRRTTPRTLPLFVSLVGLLLLGTAAPAFAEPSPTPTPTPAPTVEREPRAAPTSAPTIVSPPPGTFVGSGTTTVSGTGETGQEIQLLSPVAGQDPLCFDVVDAGEWSCAAVSLPSGPSVPLRVVVTGASDLAAEHTIAVLAAPRVTGGPTGGTLTNGTVRGTGYPGASVIVTMTGGPRCTATADASGAWSCTFADGLAGGEAEVTASQQTSYSSPSWSNRSAPVVLDFDRDRPAAPTLSTPAPGARLPLTGADYAGSGEEGATVRVFAGPYELCSTVVVSGSWICSAGGVAAGSYRVIAVQLDPAGNLGPGSPGVDVFYGDPAPSGSAAPGTAVPPTAAPAAPAAPPPSSAAVPEHSSPGAAAPASPTPQADSPTVDLAIPLPGGWSDPTRFATAVLPPWSTPDLSWFQAALLALGALLLLCVPARLLAGTVSRARDGRPLWPGMPIAGRNRAREEFETVPELPLNRWLVAGAAVLAAATLVMLSGPVTSQPAYLRLLLAVTLALLVVNAVGALVPLWWSSRVWRVKASVTFLPRYLLLVALTALASRALDIHPALVFGLLGSVTVAPEALAPRRGPLAAVRAGSLIGLAVLGWLTLGILPAADGFLSSLAAEIATSVVLAAIGSAALVLVPIGRTSGRSILAWSPPIWACLTVLAFTIMFGVLSPAVDLWHAGGSLNLWWVAGALFTVVSVSAWAWQRFVTPARL